MELQQARERALVRVLCLERENGVVGRNGKRCRPWPSPRAQRVLLSIYSAQKVGNELFHRRAPRRRRETTLKYKVVTCRIKEETKRFSPPLPSCFRRVVIRIFPSCYNPNPLPNKSKAQDDGAGPTTAEVSAVETETLERPFGLGVGKKVAQFATSAKATRTGDFSKATHFVYEMMQVVVTKDGQPGCTHGSLLPSSETREKVFKTGGKGVRRRRSSWRRCL